MYEVYSKLFLYSNLGENSILESLCTVFRDWEGRQEKAANLHRRIFREMKRLLDLATEFGFDHNLWHNYLTFLLMTNENSFSLTAERAEIQDGSIQHFARQDLAAFRALYHYDFRPIEEALDVDCFTTLLHYKAVPKKERRYNKAVSEQVQALSVSFSAAGDEEEMLGILLRHYRKVGVGLFGLNRAFRVKEAEKKLDFLPVNNVDGVRLHHLVGYEDQKWQLRENTEAFLDGYPANNVLLYGDSGTGKSTSVKALVNEYYDQGLRMIELYKHQFRILSDVIAQIKNRNYYFIILIDDLSFEENEIEYKFLKAVIEGGVETKPENILIYATSNRRHLIRETWKDRDDMEHNGDIHRSDTVEEKLSLSSRFGVQINYNTPNREQFKRIVRELAERERLDIPEETLYKEANCWEIRHGGVSGRAAQQFISYLAGQHKENKTNK